MSMGHSAGYADVIEEESIKKYCGKELTALKKAIDKSDVIGNSGEPTDYKYTLEMLARSVQMGEEIPPKVEDAWTKLRQAFYKKTELSLDLGFHNSEDEGDRYDEVSGAYWMVDGMYELTNAGKKMQNEVMRKFFVHFG